MQSLELRPLSPSGGGGWGGGVGGIFPYMLYMVRVSDPFWSETGLGVKSC